MLHFKSKILLLPGLGNSGVQHWQSYWEKQFPEFVRVQQRDWENPVCDEWISVIDEKVNEYNHNEVILVAHSLACSTVVHWAKKYKRIIKGALLVGPSDTEASTYPPGTTGFVPVPLIKLPFKTIVIASSDDCYVTIERARFFAQCWGSDLVNIGSAGHINVAAGFGPWPDGLIYLKQLDML